jgi:hypothetical protein
MTYIESELKKRRGGDANFDTDKEIAKLDPRDELYRVAERYRVKQTSYALIYFRPPASLPILPFCRTQEGNVTLSSAMLTGIPEVDLGIEYAIFFFNEQPYTFF